MRPDKFEGFEIHPLALAYPEMPFDEFEGLKVDIRKNGLCESIATCGGLIIDGRHRYRALLEIDAEEGSRHAVNRNNFIEIGSDEGYAREFVKSKNLYRRHLTAEQKRKLVEGALVADPSRSDRQIAIETKTSHPFVAKVREEMETAGDVETVSTRRDTLGREQPAKKSERGAENVQQIQQKSDMSGLEEFWGEEEAISEPVVMLDTEPSASWQVEVRENLLEANRLLKNALSVICTSEVLGTEELIALMDEVVRDTEYSIRTLEELPKLKLFTEKDVLELLEAEEEPLASESCYECGEVIPVDLLGSPVVEERGDTQYLESGVAVTGYPAKLTCFCPKCVSKSRASLTPSPVVASTSDWNKTHTFEAEEVPDWMQPVEDKGEGDLFGGGVKRKPEADNLSAFTH